MKIKKLLVMVTALSLFATLSTGSYLIHAEDDDTSNGYTESGEEDQELVPDYDTSGYEAWLPDFNPKARGFESGSYNRNGNFLVGTNSTGSVAEGTAIKTAWISGQIRSFVNVNGNWLQENEAYTFREYANVSGTFTLKRACSVHTMPAFGSKYRTGETLPAGTYQVTKEAMEFVELVKSDGKRVWVSPQYNTAGNTYATTQYGVFDNTLSSLSVSSVNGATIKQRFMPVREEKRTGIAMKPQYVTIHNTANTGYGANAAAHANLQITDSREWISWHYTVDNNEIYQSIPMNEVGYHAGDGQFIGNATTIGIEICENSDGNYAKAERNAAYLTAQILYENGMPSDAVRMHGDWSGKHCAHNIMDGTKGTMGWTTFKALVKQEYDRLVSVNSGDKLTGLVDKIIPTEFVDYAESLNLTFDNGLATGWFKEKMKVAEVSANLKKDENYTVAITTADGDNSGEVLKTGQLVTVTDNINGKTFKFGIVIYGDNNGDGSINAIDLLAQERHIVNPDRYRLKGCYFKAGNIVGTDNDITAIDLLKLEKKIALGIDF